MNKEFPKLIEQIYDAVKKLEEMTETSEYVNGKRKFTPDGHMVGSIGEVLAMYHYGIELSKASAEKHDGTVGERNVQIKATQVNRISISSNPEFLLVLKINEKGEAEEIYNGPGHLVWSSKRLGNEQKNGQRQIALSALVELQNQVSDKIERVNP